MKLLVRLYVMTAVVVFTLTVPVMGRTPLVWGVKACQLGASFIRALIEASNG